MRSRATGLAKRLLAETSPVGAQRASGSAPGRVVWTTWAMIGDARGSRARDGCSGVHDRVRYFDGRESRFSGWRARPRAMRNPSCRCAAGAGADRLPDPRGGRSCLLTKTRPLERRVLEPWGAANVALPAVGPRPTCSSTPLFTDRGAQAATAVTSSRARARARDRSAFRRSGGLTRRRNSCRRRWCSSSMLFERGQRGCARRRRQPYTRRRDGALRDRTEPDIASAGLDRGGRHGERVRSSAVLSGEGIAISIGMAYTRRGVVGEMGKARRATTAVGDSVTLRAGSRRNKE